MKMNSISAVGGVAGGTSGAAAGFAIGTLIVPGIGSIIGAVAGGIVGGFAGEKISTQAYLSIEKKIEEAKNKQRIKKEFLK